MRYERPQVRDYGSLIELTEATNLVCAEDGATKAQMDHHSAPSGC